MTETMSFRFGSRPRIGLVGRFALWSLIPIVVIGLVLAHELRSEIRGRALANAQQSALLVDHSLIRPHLSVTDLRDGLSSHQVAVLDNVLQASLAVSDFATIKVWNRDGRVVYATDHALIGHRFVPDDGLVDALAGSPASDVDDLDRAENASQRNFGQLLEVYTPLRFGSDASVPAGAFELYLPYRPIAAAISHDSYRLYLFLAGGLTLLYLLLFRIVAGASGRLRRQSEENRHLALHDALTGLPNRLLFQDRADQAVLAAKREPGQVALMILDLDRFKEVNDTLGHHNGDVLLREVGERVRSALRATDTLARLGGDEFGVLLPKVADSVAALAIGENIRRALREPFTLESISLDLDASVGISLYPEHGLDVETLLQRADVALYLAKENRGSSTLYSAERDEYSPARLALVAELRRALDEHELVLYYQPKAQLADGAIAGVEALVRWNHPQRGLLAPAEFIPVAEHTGLIKEVTLYVLRQALQQLRLWEAEGLVLTVAVNLSARDLLDFDLPEVIGAILSDNGVAATRLELEITETVLLSDPMRARAILSRLSAMGVKLAIDDFGTGYSSLAYLKRLPVSEIKIDRSFVTNMNTDRSDAAIVRSTIDLGRNLGLTVVAEGVETEADWAQLKALNCNFAQGYHLSRPIPADEVAGWVARSGALRAQVPHALEAGEQAEAVG
jgi:diguanylate cyclase (GGDEF)-like protein